MARISVDEGFCKGCGLCVDACPTHIIELDQERITAKGYHRPIKMRWVLLMRGHVPRRRHLGLEVSYG